MIKFEDPKMNDLFKIYKENLILKQKHDLNINKKKLELKLTEIVANETEKVQKMKQLQKLLIGEININKQTQIKKSISNICQLIIDLTNSGNDHKAEILDIKNQIQALDDNNIEFKSIADFIHTIISKKENIRYYKRVIKYSNKHFDKFTCEIESQKIKCVFHCIFEDKSSLDIQFKITIADNINVNDLRINEIVVSSNKNEKLKYLTFRLNEYFDWECLNPGTKLIKKSYILPHLIKWYIEKIQNKLLNTNEWFNY